MTNVKDKGLEKIVEKRINLESGNAFLTRGELRNLAKEARDYGGKRQTIIGFEYTVINNLNPTPFKIFDDRKTELFITYENGDKEEIDLEPKFNFNTNSLLQRLTAFLRKKRGRKKD